MIPKDLLPIIGRYARADVYTLNVSNEKTPMTKTFYCSNTDDIVRFFDNNPQWTYWLMVKIWSKCIIPKLDLQRIVPDINWDYIHRWNWDEQPVFYMSVEEFPKLTYDQIKTVIDILLAKRTTALKKLIVTEL